MIDNKIISQNNQHILDQYYDIIANGAAYFYDVK